MSEEIEAFKAPAAKYPSDAPRSRGAKVKNSEFVAEIHSVSMSFNSSSSSYDEDDDEEIDLKTDRLCKNIEYDKCKTDCIFIHIYATFEKDLLAAYKKLEELGYKITNSLCMHDFLPGGCNKETCSRLHLADAVAASYCCTKKTIFKALSKLKSKTASKKEKPAAKSVAKPGGDVCKTKMRECMCAPHFRSNMKGLLEEIKDFEDAVSKLTRNKIKVLNEDLCKDPIAEIYKTAHNLKNMIKVLKTNVKVGLVELK